MTNQGPTARAIISAADGSGLQPSGMFLHDAPGATPQETESAPALRAESPAQRIAWKLVAKAELLADKHVVLLAERWGNGESDLGESDSAPLGEVVEKVADTVSPSSMPAGTPCLGLEHIGQGTGTVETNVPSDPTALKSAKIRFAEGDILYGKLRPNLNKVWLASFAGICSTDFFVLRPDRERVEPRLFQFLMLSPQFNEQVLSFVRGAQLPRVSYDDLASIEIPLPPLEEQRRIVAEIEGYQKVLDGARQILAGWQLRVDAQPDWPVAPLSDAADLTGGYAFKSTEMKPAPANGSDLPVVKIGNVGRDGRLDLTDAEYHAYTPDLSRFVLRTGDIVVAMTGATVGKVAEVDRDNLLLNQRVGVVRRKETAEQKFLLHVLRSPDFYDFCQTTAGGGAQGNIAPRQILEYEIPMPPLEEQRRLVAELDAEAAQMDAVRALLPRFEAKIQRVLDRVWGNPPEATA
jgi:type I restriction enzyme M protein